MDSVKGYIVRLNKQREQAFEHNMFEGFAEPVPEFSHSKNIPLICFVIKSNGILTHIALGNKGHLAGTDLRRLNLEKIFKLTSIINVQQLVDTSPNNIKIKIDEKLSNGGLIPPKSFEYFLGEVIALAPETSPSLAKFSEKRTKRIKSLSSNIQKNLAEQKEAVATALTIASIDREKLRNWDFKEDIAPTSFLDGLDQIRLREDPMVINDLSKLPGYNVLKTTPFSSVVFENEKSKLTVILANRLPLEEQLGVDLIYYNETYKCFLMIQYKAMEKESGDTVFRFPNDQLTEEITRMNSVLSELEKVPKNKKVDGYRLNENPFFLKICPRIMFNPDDLTLIKGMYLPLGYWELLSEDSSMVGPKGGKRLSYKNVRRYFNNTEFVMMAAGGWVGTNIEQSELLEEVIRNTLQSGRSVVFAVNNKKGD